MVDMRNYLLVILTITNAARASNLMNITTDDVLSATKHEEVAGWVFKSTHYKTSIIYGTKCMVVPDDLYPFFVRYALEFI